MSNLVEALSFDDVQLRPQKSDVLSRNAVCLKSHLNSFIILDVPIIASPMDTVSEDEMSREMRDIGAMAIIHRYNTIEEQSSLVSLSKNKEPRRCAAAIGMNGDYLERAEALLNAGANILCIDVAHGHHVMMERAIRELKVRFGGGKLEHLIAGNVATGEGYKDLSHWGADSIRVGIGSGSPCSTQIVSGHGIPLFHSILECVEQKTIHNLKSKIIADGGIRNSGDIVKALGAGADFIMAGSLLAGTDQCPGSIIIGHDGNYKMSYRGMASFEAKSSIRDSSTPEGVQAYVPYKGDVYNVVKALEGGIRSGLSYSGAHSIKEFQKKAQFIRRTPAGLNEGRPHILLNQAL